MRVQTSTKARLGRVLALLGVMGHRKFEPVRELRSVGEDVDGFEFYHPTCQVGHGELGVNDFSIPKYCTE
jgi:hypothetical protein